MVQLLTFLGACGLTAARPVLDEAQAQGVSTAPENRWFYGEYAQKRVAKDDNLSRRIFYNDDAEKRDTQGKQPAKGFHATHDLDKKSVNGDLDKRFLYFHDSDAADAVDASDASAEA